MDSTNLFVSANWWFKEPYILSRNNMDVKVDVFDLELLSIINNGIEYQEIFHKHELNYSETESRINRLHDLGVLIYDHEINDEIPHIELEITSSCNARCIMCPRDLIKQSRGFDHMKINTFNSIINNVGGRGVKRYYLCGIGEPLLHPECLNFASKIKEYDKNTEIFCTSNGHILDESKHLEILNSDIDVLELSIHSLNKEEHYSILKSFDITNTIKNIELFLEKKAKLGKGPEVRIGQVLVANKPYKCPELAAWANSHGLQFDTWRAWNRAGNISEEITTTNASEPRNFNDENISPSSCSDYSSIIFIDYLGHVHACCCDAEGKAVELNATNRSLEDILRYRFKNLASNEPLSDICISCDAPATNKIFLDSQYFSYLSKKYENEESIERG